jgi:predicted metal-binding membrane protein
MIDRRTHFRGVVAAGLALAALAWAVLLAGSARPWGRYLDHGGWARDGLVGAICGALPAGEVLVPVALYAGGWVLMLTAMMLPTALPVLAVLQRMTARRPDGARLVALAAAGYLAAWTGFGLVAHAADLGVAAGAARSGWLAAHGWVVGALVLAAAGVFQFSRAKRWCLERCRSPLGQVMAHWRGRRPGREAWGLGLAHGAFCVGCCWALMLVVFALGAGNLGLMLAFGLVMAAEKNFPWGRRLSAPVGVGLIAWSAAVVGWQLAA